MVKEGRGVRDKGACLRCQQGARALTLGDGGGGVGGVRQLVRGQRGHASGREAPWQEVVERCQLVGSGLLTPTGTAVTEPDLGDESGEWLLAPGRGLRGGENRSPQLSPTTQSVSAPMGGSPHRRAARGSWPGSIPITQPAGYRYPQFTDEHTETQREWVTCPRDSLFDGRSSALSTTAASAARDVNRRLSLFSHPLTARLLQEAREEETTPPEPT